jgi:nucleoside-diphosphate-sugar epimerase
VRKQSNLRWIADLDVECYYGSLFDPASLKQGIEDCDAIIHVAGVTKARTEAEYLKGNYEGTKNLVDVCLKNAKKIKRFINIGSQAAMGPSPTIIPIDENHPPNPLTYYGKSKLAAEEYVMQHSAKLPVVNLRPSAVYGPRDTDILAFFKTVKTGVIPQLGGVDKYLSLVHVHDLVRAIVLSIDAPKVIGQSYFIANEKPYSWQEVADATLKVLDKKGIKISVPIGLLKGISVVSEGLAALVKKPALLNNQKIIEMEPDFWTCSSDKAYQDFGFRSEIDLENGVADTIAWYKENKWM